MAGGSMRGNGLRVAGAKARASRGHCQRGDSLIEVLIVVFVLGLLLPAAAIGLLTTMKLSSATQVSQRLNAGASSYVETLKETAYVGCATATSYAAATDLWTPPASTPMTVEITGVEHWSQTEGDFVATTDGADPCPTADEGAQRITVRLTGHDGKATTQVVKRNPVGAPAVGGP